MLPYRNVHDSKLKAGHFGALYSEVWYRSVVTRIPGIYEEQQDSLPATRTSATSPVTCSWVEDVGPGGQAPALTRPPSSPRHWTGPESVTHGNGVPARGWPTSCPVRCSPSCVTWGRRVTAGESSTCRTPGRGRVLGPSRVSCVQGRSRPTRPGWHRHTLSNWAGGCWMDSVKHLSGRWGHFRRSCLGGDRGNCCWFS